MELKQWLLTGFEYELWSDERWLGSYPGMPEPRHAEQILGHILWALETWLSRVDSTFSVEEEPFGARLLRVCRRWIETLSNRDLAETISYTNTRGTCYKRKLGAIALHVINHGTYHRGQLRGLAAEQGFEEFPETDLIGLLIERDLFGESD